MIMNNCEFNSTCIRKRKKAWRDSKRVLLSYHHLPLIVLSSTLLSCSLFIQAKGYYPENSAQDLNLVVSVLRLEVGTEVTRS